MRTKRFITKEALIWDDLKAGIPWREICTRRQVNFSKVSKVAKSIKLNLPIPEPKSMGRPPKVTNEVRAIVDENTLADPHMSGSHLSRIIAEKLGIQLSHATINKICEQLKFRFTMPRRTQDLSDVHISKRLNFVEKHEISGIQWDREVIISDEARFCLQDDTRRVWMKRGVYNDGTFIKEKKFNKRV